VEKMLLSRGYASVVDSPVLPTAPTVVKSAKVESASKLIFDVFKGIVIIEEIIYLLLIL
jgi:hypothetical protein